VRPPARGDPVLHLRGRPLPRPGPGERGEPAHQPHPALDQRPGQPPRRLLAPPALQHRLEQRGLGPQRHRAIHQHQSSRPRGLPRPGHEPPTRHAPSATTRAARRKRIKCHILPASPTRLIQHQLRRVSRSQAGGAAPGSQHHGTRRLAAPQPPVDAPDAAQPASMHQKAARCIMRPSAATRSDGTSRHRMQPGADIPGHRRRPARRHTANASWLHAAPQAARVHANCRMMHQMQLCSLAVSWPWCAS